MSKTASELNPTDTKTDIGLPLSLLLYNKADGKGVTCVITVNIFNLISHDLAHTVVRFS